MKVIDIKTMPEERKVKFHSGVSNRILLDEDKLPFSELLFLQAHL